MYRLYGVKNPRLRGRVLRSVLQREGGEPYSLTLCRIFRDYHGVDVGLYSYGVCASVHGIRPGTKIGRYCSFANDVQILDANHPLEAKSTHPFFYEPAFGYTSADLLERANTTVGNDVWIGSHAIILRGAERIGDGAVIGAGSIVTKDVPDYAVVAGNPARVIRYRFDPDRIEMLKREAWWEQDMDQLDLSDFAPPVPPAENDSHSEVDDVQPGGND